MWATVLIRGANRARLVVVQWERGCIWILNNEPIVSDERNGREGSRVTSDALNDAERQPSTNNYGPKGYLLE